MSGSEMHIEKDLFATVGVDLHVNTELYRELLDELSADVDDPVPPTAHFFPAFSWVSRYTRIDEVTDLRVYSRTANGGNYDPENRILSVACSPSLGDSNERLLHETKHWGQDVHGDLQSGQRWLNTALGIAATGFVGGVAGIATGISLKNADLTGLSAFSTLASPLGLLWYKTVGCKNERQAYRFQRDPKILRSYGRIISYGAIV